MMQMPGTTKTSSSAPVSLTTEGQHIRLVTAAGQEHLLAIGEHAEGWTLQWLGGTADNPKAILETTHATGGSLLFWSRAEGFRSVLKPPPGHHDPPSPSLLYGGHTKEEVLASPQDLLGQELLAHGEASYDQVVNLLPPVRGGRYQILGGPLSRGKYILWPDGTVTTQRGRRVEVIYQPAAMDARVARCTAYDGLLDDWMPIACYRFEGEDAIYDLLAFILPEDYAVFPEPFIRLTRYAKSDYLPSQQHVEHIRDHRPQGAPVNFYAALDATVRFWWQFESSLAPIEVPEARVWRWTKGCLAHAAITFCDKHPKYGAFHYGGEEHDTFPPTLLTLAETALAWGAVEMATAYLTYYLQNVVRSDGTFNYYGPSGTEYGQWLWLLNEVERWLGSQPWLAHALDKVLATGYLLESLRALLPDTSLRLVRIGAEADNRHEVYTYFSNNLWALRGLRSLVELANRYERAADSARLSALADSLEQDLKKALQLYSSDTPYGPLISSYIGYPPAMWTLSEGPALPADVPDWEQSAYWSAQHYVPRGYDEQSGAPRQWIRENTYANYRYHLESLSAMLLEDNYAEALVRLRQQRGGELLGMTRFMGWLDDWPVAAYARYLISTDRIEDYLLLYYGHMAHHGNRETLTYYEQVTIDGQVMAHDCVPCLLITPIMTRWMLCFEPIGESAVYLLRATPRAWLESGSRITAKRLLSRLGPLNVAVAVGDTQVTVELVVPAHGTSSQLYLDVRLPAGRSLRQVKSGDWIERIEDGYRLVLKPGLTGTLWGELEI
jgi:hypothetical protein